ncbi:MAG: preprotein translocase subunit SecG [Oscillospiraceae bacterium]|nr:preprotein translocase subunit SecG [Oscillospiraceae bacterium]MBQ5339252.1 preprotein translocase subunit SecG [Oscillospiraceae bacterium]MBQ9905836.1 preprotein translocase subunit SecG [Oscillospiraceae bacterium]
MSIIEIVGGIVLLLSTVLIIILCLMQDQKQDQNMTSAITGGSYDSAYSKNEGNTKEAILKKWTKWLAIIFFIVTLVITILPVYLSSTPEG